jgi:ACS family hexuronate transporter-like MFS transporter
MTVSAEQQRRFAWAVVLVLCAGSIVNYMDRAVLSVVMPQVKRDLLLSNTGYGLAVNAFLIAYMVFYILGGRLADRIGCRRAFLVSVLVWAVAKMLHAFSRGLLSLSIFRALLGVGEGGYYPAAMRGAAEWFPPENRAKAVGLFICGLSVGTLITPPLVAWITLYSGWRAAFLITTAPALVLVPVWLWLHSRIHRAYGTPDPAPAQAAAEAADSPASSGMTVSEVLRRRKYWFILFARAVTDAVWFFYLFWLPGYFQEVRGFDLGLVGRTLWIPYFAADIGALGGAWLSSGLIQRGFSLSVSRKAVLLPACLLSAIGSTAYFAESYWLALGLVSLALFGHLAWSSNIQTVITEIVPRRHVAVLYGLTGAVGTGFSALTQPLVGRLVDTSGYGPGFVGCGVLFLLAAALLASAGPIEQIRRAPPLPARA